MYLPINSWKISDIFAAVVVAVVIVVVVTAAVEILY
jgi:hypothetical protein